MGSVPLDDYARMALAEYTEAMSLKDAAEKRADEARAKLIKFFSAYPLPEGEKSLVGTVDDSARIVYTLCTAEKLDTKRLEHDNPYLYRSYLYLKEYPQLRRVH